MSIGPGGGHSTETLDQGLNCLKRQQVKIEDTGEKEALESELKDCNSTCWVCWTFNMGETSCSKSRCFCFACFLGCCNNSVNTNVLARFWGFRVRKRVAHFFKKSGNPFLAIK